MHILICIYYARNPPILLRNFAIVYERRYINLHGFFLRIAGFRVKNSTVTAKLSLRGKKQNCCRIDWSESPWSLTVRLRWPRNGEKMCTRRRIYACANARVGRSRTKPSIKARCAFDISVITGVVPRYHEHRCSRVDLFYRLCQAPLANPGLCQNPRLDIRVTRANRQFVFLIPLHLAARVSRQGNYR